MADAGELTIRVHLHVTLNGEPVVQVIDAPALWQDFEESGASGLRLFISLDAEVLAEALAPHMLKEFERRSAAPHTGRGGRY